MLSVLSIFLSCLWFNPNTQGFVYLEILAYQLGLVETCEFSRNAMYVYLLYSCFIYRHIKAFFLYRNKSYIFPMLGLAKIEYFPDSILSKSTAGRYRPVSYSDGPITARCRCRKNAYWVESVLLLRIAPDKALFRPNIAYIIPIAPQKPML